MAVAKRHKYVGDCCCNDKKPSRKNANSLEAKVTPEADDIIVLVRDSDNAGYKITYGDFISGLDSAPEVDESVIDEMFGGSQDESGESSILFPEADENVIDEMFGGASDDSGDSGVLFPEADEDVIDEMFGVIPDTSGGITIGAPEADEDLIDEIFQESSDEDQSAENVDTNNGGGE